MARSMNWDEDTSPGQIARMLPRNPHERWLDVGFGLLVAALVGGWLLLPQPAVQTRAAAPQVTLR